MSTIPFWSSILQYRNQLFKGMNNKVHYYRSKLKMSQQELANRLNVSVETIIAIENEKYTPTLALAFNISKLLHAPIEEIFKYD